MQDIDRLPKTNSNDVEKTNGIVWKGSCLRNSLRQLRKIRKTD